jgi:hypothetical protein
MSMRQIQADGATSAGKQSIWEVRNIAYHVAEMMSSSQK